jgi:hypothetical protein
MSDRDPLTLAATNEHWVIEISIPMHDPETKETRTAVVSINKQTLFDTAEGMVVRGVTVRWEGGGE